MLAGRVFGILGLVSVAVSMLLIHDGRRSGAALALAGVGAGAARADARAGLAVGSPVAAWADVVETLTLLSLLPLMVLAAGFVSSVAG